MGRAWCPEVTEMNIGASSTLSLFSSLFASGGLHVTSDESADGAQAVGKSDGLPQELVEVVGGVAATVAFTTAAFTVGPVAASTLPAAIASAPTGATSFFAAFLGI